MVSLVWVVVGRGCGCLSGRGRTSGRNCGIGLEVSVKSGGDGLLKMVSSSPASNSKPSFHTKPP